MQQIGLPALGIVPETMEVAAFNRLFADLIVSTVIEELDKGFAQQASDLAELLNTAVIDLQNLTRRSEDL